MTARTTSETSLKAATSVSQMCRLLKMSRSQFYWHVKRGTFHAPLYLASNKRPYFTATMVEDNIKARDTGVGVNGEFVIFYERQPAAANPEKKDTLNHAALIDGLKNLGVIPVTRDQLQAALVACFPDGTSGQDEAHVLRVVFRHLKRSGSV
jgi:hypothetical protein